jgi:YVTN family beta-propeller protein
MRRVLGSSSTVVLCALAFFACSVAGASAAPDTTPPVVTFTGNAGSYTADQSITLSCTASDASGIASTTCPNALSAVPAYTYFGLGLHTQSAVAKDTAGNWGAGWTSFTVAATPGSICQLTKQFLETSSHYTSAPANQRAAGDALANAACTVIDQIVPYLCPFTIELAVDAYNAAVTALVPPGWLTQAQANILHALANAQLSPNGFTPTAPTAPTNVTATVAGNTQATVIWTPPLQDDGATVTSYKVTSSPGGKTATVTCPCPTLGATITGLTNGTSYTFTATATNSAGTSVASAISNAVTPFGPPGAPTGATAAPGIGKAVVSFTAPASNGGSAITAYTVTSSPGGITATGTASPITVTGLTGGTSYTFTVVATNAAGPGPASAPTAAVTPTGVPGAPTGVSAAVAAGSGTVRFTAPASNGGSAITKYTVTAAPGGATAIGTSSPIVVTGLASATGYTFTVVATNVVGNGPGATSSSTPVAIVPSPITAEATGPAGALVPFAVSSTDADDPASPPLCTTTGGPVSSPAGFPLGTTTVTCTATDPHGNSGTSTFTVTVRDTTPPVVTVPSLVTNTPVEATGHSGAVVTYTASASDLVSGVLTPTCVPASGSTFPIGSTTVTCSATDTHGNTGTASFVVKVVDTTPPVVSVPANKTLEATGPSGATASFTATASDLVDGAVTATCAPLSGSTFPLGTTTVTCSATDAHGNTGTASFHVTVQDTTPPVVTVPADKTVEATGPSGAAVSFSASASDLVDGAVATTCSPASGSTFPLGTTTVTCSATDAHGNTASASFHVKVQDTTPPVVHVPTIVTNAPTEATGPGGAPVSYTVTATDIVGGAVTPACSPASGSTFPVGSTTVNCTATDPSGNTGTGSFTVKVVDTTPPAVSVPADKTVEATSFAGAPVSFSASAADLVDGAVTATCAPLSGSTFPLGTTTVTCSATDAHGNTGTASFHVTVQDTTPPVVTAPADKTLEATGPSGATASFAASASDVVDGAVTATCAPLSGSTFPLGTTTVTCSATDAHGNTASASFHVTVRDTTPPAVSVPAAKTVEATGPAGATVTFSASATDLVDGAVATSCSPASGSTFALGTTTVNCSATDTHGNTASTSFHVTVQDTTPPAVSAPASQTLEATSASGATAIFAASASDLVDGPVTTTCAPASGSIFPLGTTSVTCSATDAHGNTASASFHVTVQDTTAPVVLVPVNQILEASSPAGSVASFSSAANDLVDGFIVPTCLPASDSIFPLGTTTVTCSATDAHGNTGTRSFNVIVQDTTPPTVTVPADKTVEATSSSGAPVTFTASSTDAVDGPGGATCSPVSGSVFALGTTTVTCSATDAHGNSASASFHVTVQDTTPPTVTVPADQMLEATSASGATATFAASATDIVDGHDAVTCAPASGSTFPLGATPVTCTATDAHHNTATASFHVTVQDTTAPVVTVPANITVPATGPGGAVATFTSSFSDLVDGTGTATCAPASGSTFAFGTTTVTCSATDGAGNTGHASFTVTVQPTVPDAPTVGTASADSSGQVTVSFTAPVFNGGAPITGYTVVSSAGGFTASGAASPITISGLTYGTSYTFTVKATNSAGTGAASAPSNPVTPAVPPGAPTITGAVGGDASATVAFSPPASNGGLAISNYTVTANPGGITSTGSASPLHVTGLTNGQSYTFTVRATNGAGTGSPSAPSNSVTPRGLPGAPTIASVTPAAGQVTVAFSPPASDGGAPIAVYTVTSSPGGISVSGTSSPINVTGLTSGTTYTFTVTATNVVGTGPASAPSSPVVPSAPLPTSLALSPVPGSATVGNQIPASEIAATLGGADGGASGTITFTVFGPQDTAPTTCSTGGTVVGTAAVSGAGTYNPSAGFTPAATGTYWWYAAYSGGGDGEASDSGCATGAPSVVGSIPLSSYYNVGVAADPVTGQIFVANQYYDSVDVYTPAGAELASISEGTAPLAVAVDSATGRAYFIDNDGYLWVIDEASDSIVDEVYLPNYGVYSPDAVAVDPTTDEIFVADQYSNEMVTIDGSSDQAVNISSVGYGADSIAVDAGTGRVYVTNEYDNTVSVLDEYGNNLMTLSVGYYPDAVAVDPTTHAVYVGNLYENDVDVFDGSSDAGLQNGVSASIGGVGYPVALAVDPSSGTLYVADEYDNAVQVIGEATDTVTATLGVGSYPDALAFDSSTGDLDSVDLYDTTLNVIAGVMPSTAVHAVPSKPTGVSATTGYRQATVSFTAPVSAGDSPITSYTVTASPGGQTATGSGSPITVTGLTDGATYTFRVAAANAYGTGASSDPSAPVTLPVPIAPGAPTGVSASPRSRSATVSFTAPASDGGSPITTYTVSASPGNITASGFGSPITVTGLTNGTAYTFTVTATNAYGTSPTSAPSNPVTPVPWTTVLSSSPPAVSLTTGTSISASSIAATISGGVSPTGTITFTVVGPQQTAPTSCPSGTVLGTVTVNGNGTYHPSAGFTPPSAGDYWWYASYSGDVDNAASHTSCSIVSTSNYGYPSGSNSPYEIAAGPDGALWFTNEFENSVGRIDPTTGAVTTYTGVGINSPNGIAAGPDGALWFTNTGNNSIGRVTTAGVVTNYTGAGISHPYGIAAGSDGALWFTNNTGNSIGRIDPATGAVTTYTGGGMVGPIAITAGPDGALWFTTSSNQIGRIDPATDAVTTFAGAGLNNLLGIAAGADGALWFTNYGANSIGRITTAGVITTYTGSGINGPRDITAGADGALWFTNDGNATIGRIDPGTQAVTTYGGLVGLPFSIVAGSDGAMWYTTNDNGLGLSRIVADTTVKAASAPSAPWGVGATAGPAQATVSFSAPISSGGSAITNYTVTASPGGQTATGSGSPITVTGLTNGTTYTFTVTATNASGTSPRSTASAALALPVPPGAPTSVTGASGNHSVSVSFTAPASNGGSPITGYTVTASPGGATATGSSSPITVSGLSTGSTYTFTVTATNVAGTGSASAASAPVTLATPTAIGVTASFGGGAGVAIPASAITATLLHAQSGAGGTITFKVFGPQPNAPTDCSGGTTVGTASVSGNGTYNPSAGYTPSVSGDYWWYASYSGDTANAASTSACGDGAVPGTPFSTVAWAEAVGFSPNGGFLATALAGVTTFTLDPTTSAVAQVGNFAADSNPNATAFSPDGTLLAASNFYSNDVTVYSVNQLTGALTQVPGSPFAAGAGPFLAAFSPSGDFLAVANSGSNSVSVYSVNHSTGFLTPVVNSPFATGPYPLSVAFSPDSRFLATANQNGNSVSVFSVNQTTGALTQVAGSPFAAGSGPRVAAFNPTGAFLAVTDEFGNSVSEFSVDPGTGALTQVAGSPFATGAQPSGLSFSSGGLLATANRSSGSATVFSVDPTTGALVQVPGSPFAAGGQPLANAFSPDGNLLATTNVGGPISLLTIMAATIVH